MNNHWNIAKCKIPVTWISQVKEGMYTKSCKKRISVDKGNQTLARRNTSTVAYGLRENEMAGNGQSDLEFLSYDQAKPLSEIPGPMGLPYFGTMLHYRKGPLQKYDPKRYQDALHDRYQQYGKIMKETIAGVTAIRLFDPDYVRIVYQNDGKYPHVAPLLSASKQYRKEREMSAGLGHSNGEEWYRLRSAVQQMMMRPKAATVYLPLVEEVANDFINRIKSLKGTNGDVPNFRNEVARWNLESSGITCFETRLGCLDSSDDSVPQKMIDANNEIFVQSTKLMFSIPLYRYISTQAWTRLVDAEDYFNRNGQKLIDQTIAKIDRMHSSGQLNDEKYMFISYLLSRRELTYKDINIITLSLFGDGLSATVPSLVFAMYCLAKNPEVQNKAYREVSMHVQDDEPITGRTINKLTYLKACVKETHRLFPINLDVKRIPQKNLVIGGYQIPAGVNAFQTIVELCTSVLLKSPDYFTDPEKFLPERWLRNGSAHSIHPFLLTPFSFGPRMCVGRRFAEQEMFVVLAKILKNFRIEYHGDALDQQYNILMVPDRSVTFTFKDRQNISD